MDWEVIAKNKTKILQKYLPDYNPRFYPGSDSENIEECFKNLINKYQKENEELKKENEELKKFKEEAEETCQAHAVTQDLMSRIENQEKVIKRQTKEKEKLQNEREQFKYNCDVTNEMLDFVNDKYDLTKMDTYDEVSDGGDDDIRIRISKGLITNVMATNGIFVNIDEIEDFTEVVGEVSTNEWDEYVDMDKLKEVLRKNIISVNRIWEGEAFTGEETDEEDQEA